MPLERIDDAFLRVVGGEGLRPREVLAVVEGVLDELPPVTQERELETQRLALRTIDQSIANLAQAIAAAGELGPLLSELKNARAKRDMLTRTIPSLERTDLQRLDRAAIERKV